MLKYIAKRLAALIPVIMGVTLLVFIIMQLAPGNPARIILGELATPEQVAELEEEMGLNKPLLVRYFQYMLNFLRGDMGVSYFKSTSVVDEVMSRFPHTAKLAGVAAALTILMSIPIGMLAAVKQNTLFDSASLVVTLLGISMPVFWLGLLLIILFSVKLNLLPTGGADSWASYIMPAFCLAFSNMSTMARTTRSSLLETIRQDYIRTARAKGQSESKIVFFHALKNALLPVVTYCGVEFGLLMGGIVTVETIFSIHGLGNLILTAIRTKDVTLITGCAVFLAVAFMTVLLLVDILYAYIDPRIRMRYSKKS